ncbi:MAG: glycosyltransferase [Pirellulales bacterium]|nr:glycosyltransferase [Pirellulales bacterium]
MAYKARNDQNLCLSVAIIVRNEADVIIESIESVRAIADEIVVLDTGSNDQTIKVAEQHGARVVEYEWTDDFSAARNRLISECRGRWILWLDAGESLVSESAPLLRICIDQEAETRRAYLALIDMPSAVKGGSNEQVAQLRLMPNCEQLRFENRIRETLLPSLARAGMELSTAPAMIRRHARHNEIARKVRAAQRDLRLIGMDPAAHESSCMLIAKGEALSNLDRHEEARAVFRQAIEIAKNGSADMLSAYYGLLTTHEADPPKIQMDVCMEALEVFPLDSQLLCALGNYLQAQNRFELAARAFASAVEHGQINIQVWHLAEIIEIANVCWSITLQLLGDTDKATSVLEEALARHTTSERLRRRLIELYVKIGEGEQAIPLVDDLPMDEDAKAAMKSAVCGAAQAASGDWLAALGNLQSAYLAGCLEPLCLRGLAVTLMSNGQVDEADPVLRQWQEVEPENPEPVLYLDAIKKQFIVQQATEAICTDIAPVQFDLKNVQDTGGHMGTRWHRIDPAAGVLHTDCPQMPVIVQTSTADQSVGSSSLNLPCK